jgi:hypothetical protein
LENKQTSGVRKFLGYLLKYGLPLLITVLLCRLLFKGVNFHEMMTIIREQCDFRWIGLAMVVSIFSHVFRAMRWRIQLNALGVKAPLFPLTLSIFGTYAVNLVLPRLGEVWRTGYIAKRQNAPFSTVFGSMVADRLADTVTVLLLTVVTFLLATRELGTYLGSNAATYQKWIDLVQSPWLWLAIVACFAALWWFFARKTSNKFVCKIQEFAKGLWSGFAVITKMKGKGKWLLLTFAIWGCYFGQLFLQFFAFDFTADIVSNYGVLAVLVTFVLSSISMGVPSNGGIGPWQWSVIFALALYGLAKEPATAFANLVMGCQTLLLIALGIFTFVCIAIQNKKSKQ